jgi:hypothetical protein
MMKNVLKTGVVLAGAAVLLAACTTTPKVHTELKTGTHYSGYRTFALMPLPSSGPASDPGLMLRVAEPARQTLVQSLTAKGLTQVDREKADIAVNLRGQAVPKVEVTDWGYNAIPSYGWGRYRAMSYGHTDVRNFEERTLSVEIFDNKTKEVVWVGWAKSESEGKVKTEKVQQAIQAILEKFPPPSSNP